MWQHWNVLSETMWSLDFSGRYVSHCCNGPQFTSLSLRCGYPWHVLRQGYINFPKNLTATSILYVQEEWHVVIFMWDIPFVFSYLYIYTFYWHEASYSVRRHGRKDRRMSDWRQGILHGCFTIASYMRICLRSERMFAERSSTWASCITCYSSACKQYCCW